MNKEHSINELPAILFPHAGLPEPTVKKILSFFGPLTIFQPWFMESLIFASGANEAKGVQVLYPPDTLKPEKGFLTRLSEYRYWIEQNRDRGYTEFLQVNQDNDLTENTTWEIRQMIRQKNGLRPTLLTRERQECRPEPEKWHLILHLAQDVEDQKLEADKELKALRERDVPLRGIVEESEDMKSLLEDLSPFESETMGDEHRLRLILEAWIALFGGYLKENDLLVTSSRQVMGYVTELWRESQNDDQGEGLVPIRFRAPDLSQRSVEDPMETKETRLNDEKIRRLKAHLLDPSKNVSKLKVLARELEASCPWGISEGLLNVVVTYLPPIPQIDQVPMDKILKALENKTLFLVEDSNRP
jgi:hypothetical protein